MSARFWTCHWRFEFWDNSVNREYEPVYYSGSNQFRQKGVKPGDFLYIVSLSGGRLLVGGRMLIEAIVSRDQAMRITGETSLYEAREWAIGNKADGTPINFHRRLDPKLARQLLFVSPSGPPKGLFFVNERHLDVQTTRGIRRLTAESSQLLDRVIVASDSAPRTKRLVTITAAHLADLTLAASESPARTA